MMGALHSLALAYCASSPPIALDIKAGTSTATTNESLAVLLIDMQPLFVDSIDDFEMTIEIPNMVRVLEYAQKNRIPVFVLEYVHYGPTIDVLKSKIDSLSTPVTYITKQDDDGFYDTRLADDLKELQINELVLRGIYATACVIKTGKSAIRHGFGITTSRDLIADHSHWPVDKELGKEGSRWYQKNSRLARNHRDLLKIISERNVKRVSKRPYRRR